MISAGKRAQAEYIEWFPRIILLIVATVIVVVLVNYYSNKQIDSADMEMNSMFYRVYYDSIIMYSDPATGRVYSGIVDTSIFTDESLSRVFAYKSQLTGEASVGMCLTLTQGANSKTICSDKGMVEHYLPIAQANLGGGQGAKMLNITMPVSVKDGGQTKPGVLYAIIVRSNT